MIRPSRVYTHRYIYKDVIIGCCMNKSNKKKDKGFLELYNSGLYTSDRQIGKQMGITNSNINKRRIRLGLKPLKYKTKVHPRELYKKYLRVSMMDQRKRCLYKEMMGQPEDILL